MFLNAPAQPYRSEVGLQPPPAVDLASGSIIDNATYIFNAILVKIQLSLSEFKRLYLHSRLHHFAPFSKVSRGRLPLPPKGRGHSSRALPTRPFWLRENPQGWVLDSPLTSKFAREISTAILNESRCTFSCIMTQIAKDQDMIVTLTKIKAPLLKWMPMYRECDSVVSSQTTPALPNLRFSCL